jgi:hypothetical protein
MGISPSDWATKHALLCWNIRLRNVLQVLSLSLARFADGIELTELDL